LPVGAALLAFPHVSSGLSGQEVVDWSDFRLCSDCELELIEVVRFGDAEGDGIIEGDRADVAWGESVGYVIFDRRSNLKIFDDNGSFRRKVGRRGEGPGEFTNIWDVQVVGDRIVVFEALPEGTWSIFDRRGDFIEARSHDLSKGKFTPVSDGHVVVFSFEARPRIAGLPLHLMDLTGKEPPLHFGSQGGNWSIMDPFAENRVGKSVVSRPGSVWWSRAASPHVEEWSIVGEQLRIIGGELPWLPHATREPRWGREPPAATLAMMAEDADGNFWMLARLADPDWAEVDFQEGPGGEVSFPPGYQPDKFRDTRLDIFHLGERRHLGTHMWDSSGGPRLFDRGGEPMISTVEYTDAMEPQVVVYRVRLR